MERIQKALEQAELERRRQSSDGEKGCRDDAVSLDVTGSLNVSDATNHGQLNEDLLQERAGSETRLIEVSHDVLESNRLVAALDGHDLTDAYRILRTRVLQSMNANRWSALAITSPMPGCGKTLTAINLAISLAREVNRTVLLADFDLRRPSIHGYFGYKPSVGLSDYLFNDCPLSEILFCPSIARLTILPGRESIHNSSEMLRSHKMIALVDELKSRYPERLVIFDLPPVLAVDDALTFTPFADALLMVAENGGTQKEDLETAMAILKDSPLIGTVLNKSDSPAVPY